MVIIGIKVIIVIMSLVKVVRVMAVCESLGFHFAKGGKLLGAPAPSVAQSRGGFREPDCNGMMVHIALSQGGA